MPSPLEVFEEDILLVMKEEKITRDEALHLLQEELMDAQHRVEEKLDRLVEMFGVMGDMSNKIPKEFNASNRNVTTTVEAATSSLLQAPHSPTPSSCSKMCPDDNIMLVRARSSHISEEPATMDAFELGDGENKSCYSYLVTMDLPEVTHAKCSTVGSEVKCGIDQASVTFQTMSNASKDVPVCIQFVSNVVPRPFADIKLNMVLDTTIQIATEKLIMGKVTS
uniref:Uncharacterized protein n=1 Tax=Oryza nivara TaxID=4536 RepID=A0A0E0IXW5_ORYNI